MHAANETGTFNLRKNNMIKEKIRRFVPQSILNWFRRGSNQKLFNEWESRGYLLPTPHLYKQQLIHAYGRKYHCRIFLETGTFLGDMVEAQKKNFDQIISIELSSLLYSKARRRFERDSNVTIYEGDSGEVLPVIIKDIKGPAVFWLDGHYSKGITAKGRKECPIFEELNAIFEGSDFPHVMLIDDAHCFTGLGEYPTIDQVSDFIKTKDSRYEISIVHDIIRAEIPNLMDVDAMTFK